jgi:hypothetical protein
MDVVSTELVSVSSVGVEPVTGRSFTAVQVDRCLLVLAIEGDNSERAAKALRAQDVRVSSRQLRRLRERYPNRARAIHEQHFRELEDVLVQEQRALAMQAGVASRAAVRLEVERIAGGDVKDAARSAQALETTAGIATDKVLTLTGRPQAVVANLSVEDILKARRRDYATFVDGSAVEIEEAA